MNGHKPHRGRTVVATIGGSLLCLTLMVILFDPLLLLSDFISLTRIRWELPRAMERWQAQELSSYQVEVKGAIPLLCFLDGDLSVQDKRLVGVNMRENPLVPQTPLRAIDPAKWDLPGCSFQDLTVEAMFDRVESNLQGIGLLSTPLTVKFDQELGYITEYRLGRASGGGILSPSVSECCTWFEFSNLTVTSP